MARRRRKVAKPIAAHQLVGVTGITVNAPSLAAFFQASDLSKVVQVRDIAAGRLADEYGMSPDDAGGKPYRAPADLTEAPSMNVRSAINVVQKADKGTLLRVLATAKRRTG